MYIANSLRENIRECTVANLSTCISCNTGPPEEVIPGVSLS